MTRRDYVLIADALRNAKPKTLHTVTTHADRIEHTAWLAAVCSIAHAIGVDNPRFDSDRFLLACGVIQSPCDVLMREYKRAARGEK